MKDNVYVCVCVCVRVRGVAHLILSPAGEQVQVQSQERAGGGIEKGREEGGYWPGENEEGGGKRKNKSKCSDRSMALPARPTN